MRRGPGENVVVVCVCVCVHTCMSVSTCVCVCIHIHRSLFIFLVNMGETGASLNTGRRETAGEKCEAIVKEMKVLGGQFRGTVAERD